MNNNVNPYKIRIISIIFLILFIAIGILLFRWQVLDSKKFEAMAAERIRNIEIPALRGSIYAQDGSTLAYSERVFDIYAYLPEIERAEGFGKQSRDEYLKKVSEVLKIKEKKLNNLLDSGPLWIKIASKVEHGMKNSLVNLATDLDSEILLSGNFIEYTSKRLYPENSLASHTIGFLGANEMNEFEGRAGIESYWEGSLKSIEGFQQEEVDSFGNAIAILDFTPVKEQRGSDIYLTIDIQLQEVLEKELKAAVERYDATGGASVLMDPATGKILSIANFPTFDPNKYAKEKEQIVFTNWALTVPYEFGSVGKIFTVSAAFDKKLLKPKTIILPEGHSGCEFFLPKDTPECIGDIGRCRVCTFDRKPQGPMTVSEGLVKSDNIALYTVAKKLKESGLHEYLSRFRLGEPTGIEIFESYGFLKNLEEWDISDLVTYSYGHGYEANLLQLVSSVSALANEGIIMQPFIVDKVSEANGRVIQFNPKAIAKPISPETTKTVNSLLNQVFINNAFEHWYSDLKNYPVGMKSGTALIPYKDRPGYSDRINSTYVGFDISEEKTFILGVWLHDPSKGSLSSQNARMLWLNTFRGIKDYLDIPLSTD